MPNDQRTHSADTRTPARQIRDSYHTALRQDPAAVPIFGSMAFITATRIPLLSEAIDSYLADRRLGLSGSSIVMYRRVLQRYRAFAAQSAGSEPDLDVIDLGVARAYIESLLQSPRYLNHPVLSPSGQLSTSTVAQHTRCLRTFAGWLYREGWTDAHRLERLQSPRVIAPEMRPLVSAELQRLFRALDPGDPRDRRTAAMLALLLDTGMRSGEMLDLQHDCLDFQTGEIRVLGKGRKRRTVFAATRALRLLRGYTDNRPDGIGRAIDHIFVSGNGRTLDPSAVARIFRRLGRRCGVTRLHPYLLRHTFAVMFLRNNGNTFELQRLLGHSSLSTTNIYVTLAGADLKSAHRRSSPLDNL